MVLSLSSLPSTVRQKRVDAGMAMFQESKRLKDELASISTRVNDAVKGYETFDGGKVLGDTAALQQSKQELLDTFNFRLARSRAQSNTLKCTSQVRCAGWGYPLRVGVCVDGACVKEPHIKWARHIPPAIGC